MSSRARSETRHLTHGAARNAKRMKNMLKGTPAGGSGQDMSMMLGGQQDHERIVSIFLGCTDASGEHKGSVWSRLDRQQRIFG
jgi:hypothetical protein